MALKAGDLVIVIRQHCPTANAVGRMATVVQATGFPRHDVCGYCGEAFLETSDAVSLEAGKASGWYPASWLKKIPPLSELEGKERERELVLK